MFINIYVYISIIIVCSVLLVLNIRRTLYSTINVMLTACIVFCTISLLVHNFMYFGLPFFTMMSLFLGISNIALIKHEGLRLKNLFATVLGCSLVLGSILFFVLSFNFAKDNFFVQYFYVLLSYFESIMLSLMIMGYVSAKQIPKYDKDYIIILGCSISKKGGLLPLLKGRTNRAIRYAWDQEIATGKPVKYVPSGGQGPNEVMSEGSAMALYLESHGAEEYEVMAEKESKNTWENFVFSRKLILEKNPDAKVAFATTNYHIFRSGLLARKAGIKDIEAISSTTKWYFWPNGFSREVIGILAMTWPVHLIISLMLLLLVLL